MSDFAPIDRPRRARLGPTLVAAAIAFLIGLALMAYAMRDGARWLGRDAAPAAITPAQPVAAAPAPLDAAAFATRETALAAQLASLEARAATLDTTAAGAAAQAGRAEAILVAFAARRALDRGVGLGYLENELRARFPAAPGELATVIQASHNPVTLEDLRQSLDGAEPILLAGDSDWWAGIGSELRNLVVIHRAGAPSPLPSDRLARARRMLQAGNVEPALAEVARLPGAAHATNWTAAAQRFVAARRALDQLEAVAIVGPVARSGG